MATIEILKKRKKELKMTLDELSEKSGVAKRTLEDIFRGATKNPRIDTMQAIERALGLSPQWTEEEKSAGVGSYPAKLSDEEWEWIELLSELKRVCGDTTVKAVHTIIETFIQQKKG